MICIGGFYFRPSITGSSMLPVSTKMQPLEEPSSRYK
jgi:hypothetical protein